VCRACGITFIGPSPEAIRLMGDKAQARGMARAAGVPVVPGSQGPLDGVDEAQALATKSAIPSWSRPPPAGAVAGMRIVRERESLARAYATCQSEARASFGSSDLYLEKFVEEARHVEVQVLGDRNGIRVHMGERDCSIQRRHQKLLEESPATSISPATRAGLCKSALAVANAVNYVSAGTVEFLVDRAGSFYFIEMNTRIQVEHPVTELVTGFDLVREQIRIAAGESLGYKQDAIQWSGHAIECRINAEDPEHFTPSPGRVTAWVPPGGPGVRVDSHLMAGYVVPPHYDSLVAKIIVHARDRAEAVARMHRALSETVVEGIKTTIPFHLKLLADPTFLAGEFAIPRFEQTPLRSLSRTQLGLELGPPSLNRARASSGPAPGCELAATAAGAIGRGWRGCGERPGEIWKTRRSGVSASRAVLASRRGSPPRFARAPPPRPRVQAPRACRYSRSASSVRPWPGGPAQVVVRHRVLSECGGAPEGRPRPLASAPES
jgi:acetyl-CoA carboxylase biotin carboxylase subunit